MPEFLRLERNNTLKLRAELFTDLLNNFVHLCHLFIQKTLRRVAVMRGASIQADVCGIYNQPVQINVAAAVVAPLLCVLFETVTGIARPTVVPQVTDAAAAVTV